MGHRSRPDAVRYYFNKRSRDSRRVSRKTCRFCYQNRQVITARKSSSIETLNNWAIDGESRAAEWRSAGTGDQAVLCEREDLKFLTKLPAKALIDRILSPREQLSVPRRAVIECKRWDTADLDMYCWGEGVAKYTIASLNRSHSTIQLGALPSLCASCAQPAENIHFLGVRTAPA
jgi:hypothetical protein